MRPAVEEKALIAERYMSAPVTQRMQIDPNAAIPDLVRNLAEDSKRLLSDEVRLAKLEVKDSLQKTSKGVMWLALAFGVSVVMLVALTVMLVTLIGRLANGHMWIGAVVTGALELVAALWLIKKGIAAYGTPSYSLPETRAAAKELTRWVKNPRDA